MVKSLKAQKNLFGNNSIVHYLRKVAEVPVFHIGGYNYFLVACQEKTERNHTD